MSKLDTAELRERLHGHQPYDLSGDQTSTGQPLTLCTQCDQDWPCDAARALALLDKLEAGPSEEELEAVLGPVLKAHSYRGYWSSDDPYLHPTEWDATTVTKIAQAIHAAIKRSKT
jgi:hypothetical protein